MTRRWSRRQFLGRAMVCGVGLPSLLLAGCGSSRPTNTATSPAGTSPAGATGATPVATMPAGMSMTSPSPAVAGTRTPSAPATAGATPPVASPAPPGSGTSTPVAVRIVEPSTDYRTWTYEPPEARVPIGATVNWTNTGGAAHTVTADDGTSFDSGPIAPGQGFSLVMKAAGTFPYHCSLHPWMKAKITVTA